MYKVALTLSVKGAKELDSYSGVLFVRRGLKESRVWISFWWWPEDEETKQHRLLLSTKKQYGRDLLEEPITVVVSGNS